MPRSRSARPAPESALDAFVGAKLELDALLAEIAAASADHFDTSPDAVDWADVGTLRSRLARIRDVADSIAGRGEYAPES